MAYQVARANVCHAGVVYAGVYTSSFYLDVDEVDQSSAVMRRGFRVVQRLSTESVLSTGIQATVEPLSEVTVRDGGAEGRMVYRGNVLSREVVAEADRTAVYEIIRCSDAWDLDRWERVTACYTLQPVNGIVADIVNTYTENWRTGHIESGLPELAIEFSNVTVSAALRQIAEAVGAYCILTPQKSVSVLTSVDNGYPAVTITEDTAGVSQWRYREEASQVRNATHVIGMSTTLNGAHGAGETTIAVADGSIFNTAGGTAMITGTRFTYAGVTDNDLTGVSGFPYSENGSSVFLIGEAESSASQTQVASVLPGSSDGVVRHYITASRATQDEADERATADVNRYLYTSTAEPLPRLFHRRQDPYLSPGSTLTLTTTLPRAISTSMIVQSVSLQVWGDGTASQMFYDVDSSDYRRWLPETLRKIEEL